jgi:hypothetical protein
MAGANKGGERQSPKTSGARPEEPSVENPPVEEEAAVERGERIDTGKTIARGGKEPGHVPGATEQPAQDRK